ncbi:hypothetical protein TNCV_2837741 [Trichonephila clavipes]|nr:hypothetical protein TNCV_2837741 [Trichonephila clavipes]
MQEESDSVDDETDEDEDNNNNESIKGPSNLDTFSALETSTECDEAHFWLIGYVNKQNCRIWSEANPQVYVETPLHPEKLTVWCALWAGGIIGPYFFKNYEGHNVTVNGDPSLVYADKPQTLDHLEDNIRRVIADIRPQMLEKVIENWTSRLDYIRASRGILQKSPPMDRFPVRKLMTFQQSRTYARERSYGRTILTLGQVNFELPLSSQQRRERRSCLSKLGLQSPPYEG